MGQGIEGGTGIILHGHQNHVLLNIIVNVDRATCD